jgi:hypothetical protein
MEGPMIHTMEISQEHWTSFLKSIDRMLSDRPIRLEVFGRSLGDQEMGDKLPFRSLQFDIKGSEKGTLTVTVGTDRGEVTHRVVGPTRIYLGQNELGEFLWLAIEEKGEVGDVRTLIHFEHLPELQAEYTDTDTAPLP